MTEPCRLGYEEHDGYRYCFTHGGFAHYLMWRTLTCDRKQPPPTPTRRPQETPMENRPAIVLHNLRRLAQRDAQHGQKLDAQHILDVIAGKKA